MNVYVYIYIYIYIWIKLKNKVIQEFIRKEVDVKTFRF